MSSAKDFPGEVDQLDQLVRSLVFGANRAERRLSHDRSTTRAEARGSGA